MANMDWHWASTLLAATLTNSTTVASTVWPAITGPPAITLISGSSASSSFTSVGTEFSSANGYTANGQSLGANVFTTVSTTTSATVCADHWPRYFCSILDGFWCWPDEHLWPGNLDSWYHAYYAVVVGYVDWRTYYCCSR